MPALPEIHKSIISNGPCPPPPPPALPHHREHPSEAFEIFRCDVRCGPPLRVKANGDLTEGRGGRSQRLACLVTISSHT
jgi:hypothetical protein